MLHCLLCRFSGKYEWQPPTDMDFAFSHTLAKLGGRELVNKQRDTKGTKRWTFFDVGQRIGSRGQSMRKDDFTCRYARVPSVPPR